MLERIRTGRLSGGMVFVLWFLLWMVITVLSGGQRLVQLVVEGGRLSRLDVGGVVIGAVITALVLAVICTVVCHFWGRRPR